MKINIVYGCGHSISHRTDKATLARFKSWAKTTMCPDCKHPIKNKSKGV